MTTTTTTTRAALAERPQGRITGRGQARTQGDAARPRLTALEEISAMASDEARFALELGPLTTWLN